MKKVGDIYLGGKAVFKFEGASQNGATPTRTTMTEAEGVQIVPKKNEIANWGGGNDYPTKFLKELRKNGTASGALRVLKSVHYGAGLVLKKNEKDAEGLRQQSVVPISQEPEINTFFKRNQMPRVWVELISDLEVFSMAYPEFILSKDRKKIVSVHRLKTAWSRKEQYDAKQGFPPKIYYNANWDIYGHKNNDHTGKTYVIPSWFTAEEVRAYCIKKNIWKFCMPIAYPTSDEGYYNKTDWHAVFHNGWFDVSNSIAKFKKALFENQINVKYVVYIDHKYLERTHGDNWNRMKPKEQEQVRDDLIKKIDEHMTGSESAGRSIFSPTYPGDDSKLVDALRIEPIKNEIKDGSYLPDASAANSEILFAMGVDPSLIGHGVPGGKLGAGSGSDKREAFTILQTLFASRRLTTLQVWDLLQDYNGWDPNLEATFENVVLTTLDKNPMGKESTLS